MTPLEARQVAERIREAGEHIVGAWLKDAKHPEVGFIICLQCCCRLLGLIDEERRLHFGFAAVDDIHEVLNGGYDPDTDPWLIQGEEPQ